MRKKSYVRTASHSAKLVQNSFQRSTIRHSAWLQYSPSLRNPPRPEDISHAYTGSVRRIVATSHPSGPFVVQHVLCPALTCPRLALVTVSSRGLSELPLKRPQRRKVRTNCTRMDHSRIAGRSFHRVTYLYDKVTSCLCGQRRSRSYPRPQADFTLRIQPASPVEFLTKDLD